MVFAHVGTLGTVAGARAELVAQLTRRSDLLKAAGCLTYEVGVNESEADTVFVVELWESDAAYTSSLALPEVQAAMDEARPLLSGVVAGFGFDVVGSPLRD